MIPRNTDTPKGKRKKRHDVRKLLFIMVELVVYQMAAQD